MGNKILPKNCNMKTGRIRTLVKGWDFRKVQRIRKGLGAEGQSSLLLGCPYLAYHIHVGKRWSYIVGSVKFAISPQFWKYTQKHSENKKTTGAPLFFVLVVRDTPFSVCACTEVKCFGWEFYRTLQRSDATVLLHPSSVRPPVNLRTVDPSWNRRQVIYTSTSLLT